MANAITWYNDSNAVVKRVYYEGSDTVYEGMALCYNSDTTDNWTGYEYADSAETGTTAEGNQNEGKYIRVEKPANDNLLFFAGVVAGTEKTGQSGPCELDIYIPNGAVVPVRSSIQTYEGESVLAILAGDYEFQTSTYGSNRSVACAIAMEDNDCSSTEGLCLAKLFDPCVFTYNSAGFTGTTAGSSQRYELGRGVSSGTVEAKREMFNFENTGGTARVQRNRAELRGAANGGTTNTGAWWYHLRVASSSNTSDCVCAKFAADVNDDSATVSSGTKLVGMFASAGIGDDTAGGGGITVAGDAYAMWSCVGIDADSTFSGTMAHTYYEVTGGAGSTDAIFWWHAATADSLDASACTGHTDHDTSDYAIPVKIGSSTYYIIAQDSKG